MTMAALIMIPGIEQLTSEKARVPSWTDRVLYKGDGIQLVEYNRGEQTMSDHRPGINL